MERRVGRERKAALVRMTSSPGFGPVFVAFAASKEV